MDFGLSMMISGLLVSGTVYAGLLVYVRRLRNVYNDVSNPTARALVLFGIANAFLGLMGITGLYAAEYSMIWVTFMFASLFLSEMSLIISNEVTVKKLGILVFVVAIIAMIDVVISALFRSPRFILMPILGILVIGSLVGSLYLLKEIPNPFTGSIFTLILLLIIAAVTAQTGIVGAHPEYFIVQVTSLIVATAVLVSMLRPWRHIISYSVGLLAIIVGLSLAIPAYLDGDTNIIIFSLLAAFAGAATAIPLDFFIKQAIETRASTPLYISFTLLFVGLLAITHSNNFAIAFSSIGVWDVNILFIDWFLGLFGVCAFIMAAVSASLSETARAASKDVLIGAGCILLTLGHPFVENGRYDLTPLYLAIFVLLIIGFIGFFNIVYRLSKAGATMAGARFLAFMFASLALGIVAMFADRIPLEVLTVLMISAGVLLIISSPRASILRKKE
jgi:hypothetical protein